jgi:cysteine-rich repeat protein
MNKRLFPILILISIFSSSCHLFLTVSDNVIDEKCGNDEIDGSEECDTNNFNGNSCKSRGYDFGDLSCTEICQLDTTSCSMEPTCGNIIINTPETCDGTVLNEQSCETQGYLRGVLGCLDDCSGFDFSLCRNDLCGDGEINNDEECDDGYNDECGSCNSDCTGVGSGSQCGDGIICPQLEICDDGYNDECGTCNSDCSETGTGSTCGDGTSCPEFEACDDGYTDECGSCNSDCTNPGSGATCGDGIICPQLEACDDSFTDECGTCNSDCSANGDGSLCGDQNWCPETEDCDNGSQILSDGCDNQCTIEFGWDCHNTLGQPSLCQFQGDLCPGILVTDGTYTGNTEFLSSNYDYHSFYSGNESVYAINLQVDQFLRAKLYNISHNGVLVLGDTCPPSTISNGIFRNYNNSGGAEVIHYVNRTGSSITIYLLVDGDDDNDNGEYTLQIATGTASEVIPTSLISFNEYKARPSDGVMEHEWVELYYGGNSPINLTGCTFLTDSLQLDINEDIIVLPGEFFLLTNIFDSALPENKEVLFGWDEPGGQIRSTTDTLMLISPNAFLIDVIGPFDQPDWPSADEPLASAALSPSVLGDNIANDQPLNWQQVFQITPGAPNQ